jgi:uncharacterized OsmC-like protein
MSNPNVFELQAPLRAKYKSEPQAAMVTDHAHAKGASAADPFHSTVQPMPGCGVALPVGVHRALGGPGDAPTPGDILCAALAACQDSAVRMVANRLGVELELLEVDVHGEVDVRGTLLIGKNVPVGFQSMRCDVRLRAKRERSRNSWRSYASRRNAAAWYSRHCAILPTSRRPLICRGDDSGAISPNPLLLRTGRQHRAS